METLVPIRAIAFILLFLISSWGVGIAVCSLLSNSNINSDFIFFFVKPLVVGSVICSVILISMMSLLMFCRRNSDTETKVGLLSRSGSSENLV